MIRFICNDCKKDIPDEGQALNITVSLPKTENQRTARGHLCVECAQEFCVDMDMTFPVETKSLSGAPYRNERDVKLQKARNWAPGSNK